MLNQFKISQVFNRCLEDIFRAKVFKMLKKEGKIGDETINTLLCWRHSGFNVYNEVRLKRDDVQGKNFEVYSAVEFIAVITEPSG